MTPKEAKASVACKAHTHDVVPLQPDCAHRIEGMGRKSVSGREGGWARWGGAGRGGGESGVQMRFRFGLKAAEHPRGAAGLSPRARGGPDGQGQTWGWGASVKGLR